MPSSAENMDFYAQYIGMQACYRWFIGIPYFRSSTRRMEFYPVLGNCFVSMKTVNHATGIRWVIVFTP